MNFRLNTLLFILICVMLQACAQKTEYGKDVLVLDEFDFKLDLNHFFQDEDIFRGFGDSDYLLTSEEVIAENDSIMPGFIRYSTGVRSQSRPLAKYAGVEFDDLGLLTDWDDEKVLMVCGSSDYKTSEEIMSIIKQLKKEYGTEPELQKGGFSRNTALYLLFEQKDKVVQFGFYLPDVDFIEWPERNYRSWGSDDKEEEPKKVMLTDEIEKAIEQKLQEKEENNCFLFIATPEIDKVMKSRSGRSGFLVDYWRE